MAKRELPNQKSLPYSEESERAVLGALLLEPGLLFEVRNRLDGADFFVERHRLLFGEMLAVVDSGACLDMRTIHARLEQVGQLEAVGGLVYLATLDLDLPDIGRLDDYVEIVKDRALRRQVIRAAQWAIQYAMQSEKTAGEIAAELMRGGEAVASVSARSRWRSAGEVTDELLQGIEEGSGTGDLEGLQTGFREWDRLGPGLLKGSLLVLAGRPGMGKTSLAMDLVRRVAISEQRPVGVFSIEQQSGELGLKLLSSESTIAARYIRRGFMSTGQWASVYEAARRLQRATILLDDSSDLMLRDLESRAALLKLAHPDLALLVIDYLQLVSAGVKVEQRRLEVALVARRLKRLARHLEVPVLALSQLSREVERRSDPRPVLADLAESGNIEQDADQVAFIHRPEVYAPEDESLRGLAEIVVAKYRHGQTGTAELAWSGATTSFSDLRSHAPASAGGPDPF
jgi:replicative DNA helicase